MSVKCAVCGKAIVSKRGQVCIACQVKQNSIQGNIPVPDIQGTYTTGQPQDLQTQQPLYTQPAKTVKMKTQMGNIMAQSIIFNGQKLKRVQFGNGCMHCGTEYLIRSPIFNMNLPYMRETECLRWVSMDMK